MILRQPVDRGGEAAAARAVVVEPPWESGLRASVGGHDFAGRVCADWVSGIVLSRMALNLMSFGGVALRVGGGAVPGPRVAGGVRTEVSQRAVELSSQPTMRPW